MRPARILAVVVSAVLGVAGGVATALVADNSTQGVDPLNLGVTMVDQPCTGDFLLVTATGASGSPLGPGISADPDHAHYLSIGGSCRAAWKPRGTLTDGYAAYLGPYTSAREACGVRVQHRGAFVTRLRDGSQTSVQCLCFIDEASLPVLEPGQVVDPADGVYARALEELFTSMHLLRLDHHFDGHVDPLMVRAVKQVQADAALPQNGVLDSLTWHSAIKQGCQELTD